MMHGQCGVLSPKCIKDYPKQSNEFTWESLNGYTLHRRRDNGTHREVSGSCFDNRYVVPCNPYILAKLKLPYKCWSMYYSQRC